MRKEILDFRFFLTAVLVVLSLSGQHLRNASKTEAQNFDLVEHNVKVSGTHIGVHRIWAPIFFDPLTFTLNYQ